MTQRIRYWDLASSIDGDYSVGLKMARAEDGLFFVEDVVRGQWLPGQRDKIILQTAHLDGPEVPIVIEQEPGSSGVSLIAYLTKLLAGFTVSADRPTGDKIVRAMPLAAQFEAGNIRVLKRDWTAGLIAEFLMFPSGAHDDQVDASSGAFNKLALGRRYQAPGTRAYV